MRTALTIAATVVAALSFGTLASAPATAATTHTVTITLTNSSGTPLTGGQVELEDTATEEIVAETNASQAGIATFTGIGAGRYIAMAYSWSDGATRSAYTYVTVGETDATATIKVPGVTLIAGTATVGGSPAAGVDLAITNIADSYSSGATTNASGRFVAEGRAGTYTLSTTQDDWRTDRNLVTYYGNTVRAPDAKRFTVQQGVTTTANIAVVRGATITGRVVDVNGKGVAGIEVNGHNTSRYGSTTNVTDATGKYTLYGLATGVVEIDAQTTVNGKVIYGYFDVTAKQGATVTAPVLTLRPPKSTTVGTAKITGWIKTPGSSVTAQTVTLQGPGLGMYPRATPTSTGAVTFNGLVGGTYKVVVSGTNIARTITVAAGKSASFGTLTRGTLTTLTGVIKASTGLPLAGAQVFLTDSYGTHAGQATADAAGKYSIKGLISGVYYVYVYAFGSGQYMAAPAKFTATVGKNAVKSVTLIKGATLVGYVKHGTAGVKGVQVQVAGAFATTDATGRYVLKGVQPGKATLRTSDPFTGGYLDTERELTVVGGTTTTVPAILVS